ncbi:MAG: hypothetical protein ACLR76_04420 [Alistipes sp.]
MAAAGKAVVWVPWGSTTVKPRAGSLRRGTGADVMRLARAVQRDVAERFGVRIEMEVNLL